MKFPFTIYDCRLPIWKKSPPAAAVVSGAGAAGNRQSRAGMALVITLILLSVTLVMAIALLALAGRERNAVTGTTDATTARLATDSALAAAQAQIVAAIQSTNAASYNFGLLVATNYINADGFLPGIANPANVNYYYGGGLPLSPADYQQNIANLQILPRAPVFIVTNAQTGAMDFRYYLDLNRNGLFDDTVNGNVGDPQWIGVLAHPELPHSANNQFVARYTFVAVPVGNSLDLNYVYNQVLNRNLVLSQDGFVRNQGVGSWELNLPAFLADLNTNAWDTAFAPYLYNRSMTGFPNTGNAFNDAFSLLAWRYNYNYNNLLSANSYFFNAANVLPFDNIDEYSDGPLQTTVNTNADFVADNPKLPWAGADSTNRFFDVTSDLFDPAKSSAFFTNRLTLAGIYNNGTSTSNFPDAYDRYTFYRMLAQLGTDTTPNDADKMNLNYDNLHPFIYVSGGTAYTNPPSATNLMAWTPLSFFTNAADRMLRLYTTNWFQSSPSNYLTTFYGVTNNFTYSYLDALGNLNVNDPSGIGLANNGSYAFPIGTNQVPAFGITNIPVYVNGQFVYSPAVNRVLQLAANIYDASTNSFYPSVFRPTFHVVMQNGYKNVYINGYEYVPGVQVSGDPRLSVPKRVSDLNLGDSTVNVYGVPWIIGAKKYMPNFNQFYSFNSMQVTRKLQLTRKSQDIGQSYNSTTSGDYTTNQMITLGITNSIGFSLWNSYAMNYPGGAANYPFPSPNIIIYVGDVSYAKLSNSLANAYVANSYRFVTNIFTWPGSAWNLSLTPGAREAAPSPSSMSPYTSSFITGTANFTILPTDSLNFDSAGNFTGYSVPAFNLSISTVPQFPQISLLTTNLFQAYILDHGHVIDYVQFDGPTASSDLAGELRDPAGPNDPTGKPYMWSANLDNNGLNWGVYNQIAVSKSGLNAPNADSWVAAPNAPPGFSSAAAEAAFFGGFFTPTFSYNGKTYENDLLTNQAPYTPTRTIVSPTEFAVNDPLVHYLASDLPDPVKGLNADNVIFGDAPSLPPLSPPQLNVVADRYQPWGRDQQMAGLNNVDKNPYNFAYKDPLVYGSDNWDFPGNKYPTAGWLGRVHRGTPWQTVYLKASDIRSQSNGVSTWQTWSGNQNGYDAANDDPVQDRVLFDVFTTALGDNASRGTLSVNQTQLAAWSAVLSGVMAISNSTPYSPRYDRLNYQTNLAINPAGPDQAGSPLWQIVNGPNGINATRRNKFLFPMQAFTHVGDLLSVPALTEQSPFINAPNGSVQQQFDVSDEMYEWLPQQTFGLLRVGSPRYVIYSYGQALRPAPNGTVLSSGLVTNYQVVAESAARTVLSLQPQVQTFYSGNTVIVKTNYTTRVESYNVLGPP